MLLEVICNPVGQAAILNRAGTELNLLVGLCLGHDMLFNKHSAAPVTTVIVKDRVLANNPAGALYSRTGCDNKGKSSCRERKNRR